MTFKTSESPVGRPGDLNQDQGVITPWSTRHANASLQPNGSTGDEESLTTSGWLVRDPVRITESIGSLAVAQHRKSTLSAPPSASSSPHDADDDIGIHGRTRHIEDREDHGLCSSCKPALPPINMRHLCRLKAPPHRHATASNPSGPPQIPFHKGFESNERAERAEGAREDAELRLQTVLSQWTELERYLGVIELRASNARAGFTRMAGSLASSPDSSAHPNPSSNTTDRNLNLAPILLPSVHVQPPATPGYPHPQQQQLQQQHHQQLSSSSQRRSSTLVRTSGPNGGSNAAFRSPIGGGGHPSEPPFQALPLPPPPSATSSLSVVAAAASARRSTGYGVNDSEDSRQRDREREERAQLSESPVNSPHLPHSNSQVPPYASHGRGSMPGLLGQYGERQLSSADRERMSAQQKFEKMRTANPYGSQHLQGAPGTSRPQYSRSHPGLPQQWELDERERHHRHRQHSHGVGERERGRERDRVYRSGGRHRSASNSSAASSLSIDEMLLAAMTDHRENAQPGVGGGYDNKDRNEREATDSQPRVYS
ncbi:hypothetical protein BD410DRAFT_846780 [Rickenella mellea]|uniref:Uncharacterized protein n=1 Tax=Rickenella mellea TaxID=50990 RepID=A0A4Y7PFL3_9AGAM|nr:hypothetical protein BD410DRAFT_846780 [Rickenella mellea]